MKSERAKKVRLGDVARQAEVSAATVSRFINGSAEVTPETRDRIVRAAKRLGFDLSAGKKSRIIAYILSNRDVLHPFHSSILVGAETYCAEYEYGLLFLPLQYSLQNRAAELTLPDILRNRHTVSGAIVAGTNSQAFLDALSMRRMPWVALGNNVLGHAGHSATSVYFDDVSGAYDLTRYLQSLGHRQIAFAGDLRLPWYARRFEGYTRAMTEAGLAPLSRELNPSSEEAMGYLAAKLYLQQSPRVTAIFAGDDSVAAGVYKAMRDSGLSIPRDMSVVGFNDTPEATFLHPALTSVRVFTNELGRQLAETLLKIVTPHGAQDEPMLLPTQLVRRESCVAPAQVAPPPSAAAQPVISGA